MTTMTAPTTSPTGKTFQDLQDLLRIDVTNLDTATLQQPVYYEEVVYSTAAASERVSLCKLYMENTEARLGTTIRENDKGEKKMTVDAVDKKIKTSPEYIDAQNQLIVSQKELDEWTGLKRAWEMRQDSIKNIINLMASGYSAYSKTK